MLENDRRKHFIGCDQSKKEDMRTKNRIGLGHRPGVHFTAGAESLPSQMNPTLGGSSDRASQERNIGRYFSGTVPEAGRCDSFGISPISIEMTVGSRR
jgi:hypothetical protein